MEQNKKGHKQHNTKSKKKKTAKGNRNCDLFMLICDCHKSGVMAAAEIHFGVSCQFISLVSFELFLEALPTLRLERLLCVALMGWDRHRSEL